jgi:hypothetical protein
MPDNVPQLLTLLEVGRLLCVSPHTVRGWVRQSKLRPVRICRRLLFHPDEISRFLAAAESQVPQQCPTGCWPSDHLTIRGKA